VQSLVLVVGAVVVVCLGREVFRESHLILMDRSTDRRGQMHDGVMHRQGRGSVEQRPLFQGLQVGTEAGSGRGGLRTAGEQCAEHLRSPDSVEV
jgi:hypothetical protein